MKESPRLHASSSRLKSSNLNGKCVSVFRSNSANPQLILFILELDIFFKGKLAQKTMTLLLSYLYVTRAADEFS